MGQTSSHAVDVLFVCHINGDSRNLDGRLIDIPDVVAAGAAYCAAAPEGKAIACTVVIDDATAGAIQVPAEVAAAAAVAVIEGVCASTALGGSSLQATVNPVAVGKLHVVQSFASAEEADKVGSIALRICLAEGSGCNGCCCTLHGVACTCVVHGRLAITHLRHDVPLGVVCHIGNGTDARHLFTYSEEGVVGNDWLPLGECRVFSQCDGE